VKSRFAEFDGFGLVWVVVGGESDAARCDSSVHETAVVDRV
jgi:hypothetical protein